MAQIIKHRRGLIGGVKNLTARNGELIIASGSISDLSGPFVFIGSPNAVDEGVAGAFNSVSKLYTGTAAPTITAATYGSALDGTPYYASGNKSLYILNNSNVGNTQIDLTGNIENNTISGVTINNLQSTNVTASYVSASFKGDGTGLYNVPASGVTGLELNQIGQGAVTASITEAYGFNVNTNSAITGTLNVNGNTSITGTFIASNGAAFIDQGVVSQNSNVLLTSGSDLIIQDGGDIYVAGNVYITGSEYVDFIYGKTNGNNYLAFNGGAFAPDVELNSTGSISLWAEGGPVNVTGSLKVTGDATVENDLYVSGNIYQTGSFYTQGSIVLSGSINIGNSLTGDTINFGGEVNSDILPTTGSTYDLGKSGQTWNNVWGETAHFTNINIGSISVTDLALPGNLTVSGTTRFSGSVGLSGYTANDVIFVGTDGTLIENTGFTFNPGTGYLSAPIINATNDGNGTNFLVGNDIWIGDVNEADAMKFKGADNSDNAKVYLGNFSSNNFISAVSGNTTLSTNDNLYLESSNGTMYFNNDSNGDINFDGDTYFNTSTNMYVTKMVDNNDGTNYLQLYGNNTNNSSWWESGTGKDTTLYSDETANINILNRSGKINISGSSTINISSVNGTNVTGSLVVSDASGVFNSSLVANNSDLTLTGGSNINMEDGAHLYFDGSNGDIYYNTGDNELTLYNDANNSIRLDNNVNITNDLYVSGSEYVDTIYGQGATGNYLALNGGPSAPDVELESQGQISLYSEGAGSNYAINMTGSVYLADNLNVTGSSTFLGGVTFGTSPTITGLTENRIVIVGTNGVLEDDANFTFDATTFKIGNGDFEVDLSGNTRTSGSLLVKNSLQLTGSLRGYDVSGSWAIVGNGFGQTTIQSPDGALLLQGGYGGVQINGTNPDLTVNGNITGNQNLQISGNTSLTGSLTVASGSATMLGGDLYVSGNLQVLGSSTNVTLESSTVNIGDNIIQVNAYSPFDRYAGLSAYDSGSSGASGSFLWDSTNDYWLIVNANSYSSKIIGTTASTGGTGTEISLTSGVFPIASASNTIEDSLLTYSGTTLAFNTNKFTVESVSGNTAISGNLTLSYSGGTDGGTKTSRVTFRNSSNVIGFVSTTETTNELDGILGYNHSSGVLEFSSLIDGGTY